MENICNVRVFCRIKPLQSEETALDLAVQDASMIKINQNDFVFDHIFNEKTSQQNLFESVAKGSIDDLFTGYNSTIFAYGQTGSGKTFTMMGNTEDEVNKGLIPRIAQEIFVEIANTKTSCEFLVKVSFMEIYMEKIRDLLCGKNLLIQDGKPNLHIHEDLTRGIFVKDLTEKYVTSASEILQVIETGTAARAVASTKMNENSSRSHTIFTITLSKKNLSNMKTTTGKMHLVDLAGSEKVSKSGATGQTLEEAKKINLSLSTLGIVINSLSKENVKHIPYRNSKLTRMLQESLGGNSKTTLIINISKNENNEQETISSLRFGVSAKNIKTKPMVNEALSETQLRAMLDKSEAYIKSLKTHISCLQRELALRRQGQDVPQDDIVHFYEDAEQQGSTTGSEEVLNKLDFLERENKLLEELSQKDEEIEVLQDEFENLLSQLRDYQGKSEATSKELVLVRKELAEVQEESISVQQKEREARIIIEGLKEENSLLKVRFNEMEKQNSEIINMKKSGNRLSSMQERRESMLKKTLASSEKEIEPLKLQIDSLKDLIEQKQNEIETLKKFSMNSIPDEIKVQIMDLMNQMNEQTKNFENQKRLLNADLNERCKKIIQLELMIEEFKLQREEEEQEAAIDDKRIKILEKTVEDLTITQTELIEQNLKWKNDLNAMEKKADSKDVRIRELERSVKELESFNAEIRQSFEKEILLMSEKRNSYSSAERPILLHTHTRPLTKVIYNREGDLLFTASKDNSPNVWYSHNGERLGTFNGHNGSIWSLDVTGDSRMLLSGSADATAKIWDVSCGKLVNTLTTKTSVRSVDYSMGDKELLLATDAKMGHAAELQIYSMADLTKPLRTVVVSGSRPTVAYWSDCNRFIITGHDDGSLCRWNPSTGEKIEVSKIHSAYITDLQFSKCGTYFISSSKDHTAKLVDCKSFEIKKTFKTERPVNSASISPIRDEVVLAGGQEADKVTTTSTRAGKFEARFFNAVFEDEIGRVKGHFGPINTIAYHPRGIGFASGAEDGYVRIHEFDKEYYSFNYADHIIAK